MTWHDLGEPGIVPPGFRDPISEQSMDSRLAVQLMKDALCSAIQGGHVRLEEVLQPAAHQVSGHAPMTLSCASRTIAAGCAGSQPLPATAERVG